MAILPEGFSLPPPTYLALLFVAAAEVGREAYRRRPAVTPGRILAFAPWMVLGSALHVLYVLDSLPGVVRPLAGTPAVYVTVAILGVATWVATDARLGGEGEADGTDSAARVLGGVGAVLALAASAAVLLVGASRGTLSPAVPGIGLVASTVVAAAAWAVLVRAYPPAAATGAVGGLAVFGHALDAVSTAVGVDLLGFGERTPLSRFIIEFAHGLPTDPYLGGGWLFVLVKLAVVCGVVSLFADYVREDPTEGFLLLGFVAAVGLGPGAHNLLLFTVA
ncbi:DUF63 family protein [Halopelagius longus]|uniref:DUF63 family protein n=1 Tax=Halopelagius longus TaxID=1236180 RepID=A0A1H0YIP5_9EURY|nr:DUF63 family protein [Halopelagius longus]RDI72516.1 DUF63 family protein [Halopelagius longus]SDQ15119.1 Uncharacterized membrane protein [Halopelagius longus]